MGKTLYIHIGSPKTGTSSLQKFFGTNQEALYEDGVIFRHMPFPKYHWEIPNFDDPETIVYHDYASGWSSLNRNGMFLLGSQMKKNEEKNILQREAGFRLLLEWFQEKDIILLSDEVLYRRLDFWPRFVKDFAEKHGITVKIIVYLRRQPEYLDSLYRQDVKLFLIKTDYHEFTENQVAKEAYLAPDYAKHLEVIAELFGRENILVRPYDVKRWKQEGKTIYDDFLSALGLSFTNRYVIPKVINPSLTFPLTALFRRLNHILDRPDPRIHKLTYLLRLSAYRCIEVNPEKQKYSYLTENENRQLLDSYRDSNHVIEEKYLEGEPLFDESLPETVLWEPDIRELEENFILFYGEMTSRLWKELKALKEENERIKKHILFYRIRNFFRHNS